MKKLISTILATVMVLGCMTTSVFAANLQVHPLSEAPKQEYTKAIGPVTFSNYLEHVESKDAVDFNGQPIKIYNVKVGMDGCAASNNSKSEFVYQISTFNNNASDRGVTRYEYQVGTGMYFKNGSTTPTASFESLYVKAYVGNEIGNNVYDKQIWQFMDDPDAIQQQEEMGEYWKTYMFKAYDDSKTPWYYIVNVTNRTDYKGDGGRVTTSATPVKPAETTTANPSSSFVYVNGRDWYLDAYNINGNNYFKLRDIAFVLNGTEKQFEVGWDNVNKAISLTPNHAYSNATLSTTSLLNKEKATKTDSPIYVDNTKVDFTAYNIKGNNYFKLRDLGQTFDFYVGWDSATKSVTIDTTKGYQ